MGVKWELLTSAKEFLDSLLHISNILCSLCGGFLYFRYFAEIPDADGKYTMECVDMPD